MYLRKNFPIFMNPNATGTEDPEPTSPLDVDAMQLFQVQLTPRNIPSCCISSLTGTSSLRENYATRHIAIINRSMTQELMLVLLPQSPFPPGSSFYQGFLAASLCQVSCIAGCLRWLCARLKFAPVALCSPWLTPCSSMVSLTCYLAVSIRSR